MTIEQLQSLLARVGEVKRTIGRMAVEVVENDGDDDIAVGSTNQGSSGIEWRCGIDQVSYGTSNEVVCSSFRIQQMVSTRKELYHG